MNDIVVKHVYGSLYDLFFGRDGWENWTRVTVKKGSVTIVSGAHRNQALLQRLFTKE